MKRFLLSFVGLTLILGSFLVHSQNKELTKEQLIGLATQAVEGKGFSIEEVNVIYDEGGKLWSERLGALAMENTSSNYGILKEGFLRNYRIVYFDFKEPLKDVWVFIDRDTGEVFTVYQES